LDIGKRIAKIRKSKNLPQDAICKGVISRSHLSNIESGRYEPVEDILVILAEKLDVPKEYLLNFNEFDENIDVLLLSFNEALDIDMTKAQSILENISSQYPLINSLAQEAYFFLLECCFHLKKHDLEQAKFIFHLEFLPLINEKKITSIPTHMREKYFYIKGVFLYYKKDYLQSYKYYLQHLLLIQSNIQKGAIFFNIALVLLKLYDVNNAISYAKQARSLYLDEHQWNKAADAYNLTGVLYWENQEFDMAEEQLLKALDISSQHSLEELEGRIYHNLGLIYVAKQNKEKALYYLFKSLTIKKKTKYPYIDMSYRSILNIYIEQGMIQEAKQFLEEAQANCEDQLEANYLKVIEARLHLKMGQNKVYEVLFKEAIEVFHSNERWKHLIIFSEELGDYFSHTRKYKPASHYYKTSVEASKKLYGGVEIDEI
jgi:tetratricopeptide (TPR) repeat protein